MTARKEYHVFVVLALLFASVYTFQSAFASADEEKTLPSALAVFPENHFEFKPVVDGTLITHEFSIQNKGKAPLSVHKVKTG